MKQREFVKPTKNVRNEFTERDVWRAGVCVRAGGEPLESVDESDVRVDRGAVGRVEERGQWQHGAGESADGSD